MTINQGLKHDPALGATPDGGLLKTGGGVLTLGGANTYTGGTFVDCGMLEVTNSDALANGGTSLTVAVGGTFIFYSSAANASPIVVPANPPVSACATRSPGIVSPSQFGLRRLSTHAVAAKNP